MLEIRELTMSYGDKAVLDRFSLSVPGEGPAPSLRTNG